MVNIRKEIESIQNEIDFLEELKSHNDYNNSLSADKKVKELNNKIEKLNLAFQLISISNYIKIKELEIQYETSDKDQRQIIENKISDIIEYLADNVGSVDEVVKWLSDLDSIYATNPSTTTQTRQPKKGPFINGNGDKHDK